jgi:hypothetical protein
MTMNTYNFEDNGKTITISAPNYRTAERRFLGYLRGELDIHGKTILASKRSPKGDSMRKNKEN